MSLARKILRIPVINHTVRVAGDLLIPGDLGRKFDRKLPLLSPFQINLPNGEIIHFQPFGDICSKWLKYDGWDGYEGPSVRLFYQLAQKANIIFDVGAYLGYFGILAAASNKGNRAYIFEAVPDLADKCRQIARINPHLALNVIQGAVGNTTGTVSLYMPDDPLVSDTSTNPTHRPNRKPTSVPAIRLDDFVKENQIQKVDLLKIDTETTEPQVLEGMAEILEKDHPTIIAEVLPEAQLSQLEDFASKYSYSFSRIDVGGLLHTDKIIPDSTKTNLNYVFYAESYRPEIAAMIRQRP